MIIGWKCLLIALVGNCINGFLWRRPFGCSFVNRNVIPKPSFTVYDSRNRFDGVHEVPDGPNGEFPDLGEDPLELERASAVSLDGVHVFDPDDEDIPYDNPTLERMRQEEQYLPDELMYLDDLKSIWSEYCEINHITAEPESTFTVEKVLPLVMKDNVILKIEERRPQREVRVLPVYWTDKDLRKLWEEWKPSPPELKSPNYSSYEAWALVPDQNYSDPDVNIITERELRRVWRNRAKTTLGMPAAKFNIKDALKIVTPMRFEDDPTEYEDAFEYIERVLRDGEPKMDFSHIEDPVLREKLTAVTEWIERRDIIRSTPSLSLLANFRSESSQNTVDSLSQMLETELPKGAEDDYPGQFPDIVNTMGDPERVFPRTDLSLWEELDLPGIGPKYHPAGTKTRQQLLEEEWEEEVKRVAVIRKELEEEARLNPKRANPLMLDTAPRIAPKKMFKDEESFFNYFDTKEPPDPDDFPGINGTRAKHYTKDQRYLWDRDPTMRMAAYFPMHVREAKDMIHNAPERYAERVKERYSEEDDYIDYDTAKLYNSSFFELRGDRPTDDDHYFMQTLGWVENFTDLYLRDWYKIGQQIEADKYKQMVEYAELYSVPVGQEPIPEHLTADKYRGVNYSMELIEMFSKVSLRPVSYWDDHVRERWPNETFEADPDATAFKAQGSLRIQYDWQPSDNRTFSIDPVMAEVLEPLQEFAGNLVELQSTSEGVIIYNYLGPVKHIIGIRSTMLYYAQQLDPTIKDLRLETTRLKDPRDYD